MSAKDNLKNFSHALKQLNLFLSDPILTNRDKAGLIKGYEFTYETSWKALQSLAKDQGVQVIGAKDAFQFAILNGFIRAENEPIWVEMIKDSNYTVHAYIEEVADKVVSNIQKKYQKVFIELESNLQKGKIHYS